MTKVRKVRQWNGNQRHKLKLTIAKPMRRMAFAAVVEALTTSKRDATSN